MPGRLRDAGSYPRGARRQGRGQSGPSAEPGRIVRPRPRLAARAVQPRPFPRTVPAQAGRWSRSPVVARRRIAVRRAGAAGQRQSGGRPARVPRRPAAGQPVRLGRTLAGRAGLRAAAHLRTVRRRSSPTGRPRLFRPPDGPRLRSCLGAFSHRLRRRLSGHVAFAYALCRGVRPHAAHRGPAGRRFRPGRIAHVAHRRQRGRVDCRRTRPGSLSGARHGAPPAARQRGPGRRAERTRPSPRTVCRGTGRGADRRVGRHAGAAGPCLRALPSESGAGRRSRHRLAAGDRAGDCGPPAELRRR